MRVAVVPGPRESGLLRRLSEDGSPEGDVVEVADLVAAVREYEQNAAPRWVWPSTTEPYQRLLHSGVRVARCHDVALADSLILGRDAAFGPDTALGRDAARALLKTSVNADAAEAMLGTASQQWLFDLTEAGAAERPDQRGTMDALIEVHADQLRRIAADAHPDRFGLLVTAESAGALVAAEMSLAGLPWRPEVHDALLTDLLGRRPTAPGQRPARLADLAAQVAAAFGSHTGGRHEPVNPDSPAQLLQALAADGIRLPSTRLAVLRDVDHPAIAPLLEYKELARLHSAFGWSWLDTWVRDGRFRPEYVVGGVVSGRWASRGGGALQIPGCCARPWSPIPAGC